MISTLDTIVIVAYMLLMLVIGYFSGKDNKDQDDYFFAKNSMPWLPVALSVAATMISANGFVGGPGWAYNDGMFPFMVNVTVPLAIFFALYIMAPIIYKLKITSIYEYVGLRFGKYSRGLAITQFFTNSLIQASSMVYIPVLIISKITNWPLELLVPVVVLVSVVYTLMGGIKAVIWTDTIQMVVVIGAVVLIMVTAIVGIETDNLSGLLKESGKLDTFDFSLDITNNNTFLITLIGGTFMWVRYFCFDQAQVQRIMTARNLSQAKKSYVISGLIMNIVYYFMLFIGVLIFLYYNGRVFESPNDVMITFVMEVLPAGVVGLIIASIFAAAMSSIDSILNSMVTVFSKDVYEHYLKKEQATLKVTMLFTVAISIVMTVFIFVGFSSNAKSIIDLVGSYISYFSGPAAGIFILGIATTKTSDIGASIGFVVGLVGNIVIANVFNTGWLINPFIGGMITILVGYFSSFAFNGKASEEVSKYTAKGIYKNSGDNKKDSPFYFGTYEKIILAFFLLQYVVLYLIQY